MKFRPYSEYKQSNLPWLGEAPKHWEVVSLRWISKRYAGGTPDKSNDAYWEGGTIPWLNSGAVNQGLITEPSAYITEEAYLSSSTKWIPKGALVMALAGQGKTKGMAAQLGIRTTCNQSMAAIVPYNTIYPRFLYWWLIRNYINIRNLAGGEARDGLNLEMIGAIPCPVLPIEEQESIAKFLDIETKKIDDLIPKKRELVEKLKEKRSALISRVVTCGLPPEVAKAAGLNPNPKIKHSGIDWLGEMPEKWTRTNVWLERVKGNLELQDGNHGELHPKASDYVGEGIPFVMANHIANGRVDLTICSYIEKKLADSLRIGFSHAGDVLLTHKGTVGRVGIVQESKYPYVMLTPQVTYYRCKKNIFNKYIFWMMQSDYWQDQLKLLSGIGTTRAYIGLLDQKTLSILLPPLKEQYAISGFLDGESEKIDRMIEKIKYAILKLEEYRSALITNVITGKIDVREVAI